MPSRKKICRVVGRPKLDPPELESAQPYTYDATVEVTPPIAEVEFKGLNLKRNPTA